MPKPATMLRSSAGRTLFFAAGDALLWACSLLAAFLIRFDGVLPAKYVSTFPWLVLLFVPIKLLCHSLFRLYRVAWSLAGMTEVVAVAKAAALSSVALGAVLFGLRHVPALEAVPRSVLLLDLLLSAVFVAGFRLLPRLVRELRNGHVGGPGIRVLLVGAGTAGDQIARAMANGNSTPYRPVAFIDDDRSKHGTYVAGLRVVGGREAIPAAVKAWGVEEVVITIPSGRAAALRDIVRHAREAGVTRIKVLPSVNELLTGHVTLRDIRDVNFDDLLGRQQIRLNTERVNAFLAGKTVMVSGSAGSIGSELARQLARSAASCLLLLDTNETGLFDLEEILVGSGGRPKIHTIVADLRDANKVGRVFATWRPDVVYHAAAYKHVPLMERHPDEAIRTNIFGTLKTAEAALGHGTQTFVLISTDKAVAPSSVMGATKRVAELIMKALNGRGGTRFMAVRFGNVVGSRGSVVPVMQEQIRRGGPVTVTHPEMTRYFMSIQEAVALVLQASAMHEGHEILTLDMGEPINILRLAQELIRLSGFEPDRDIPIVFTGVRPGEKLHEVLETTDEPLRPTDVPKLYAVTTNGYVDEITLRLALQELERLSRTSDAAGMKRILQRLTTDHQPVPLWSTADA